MAKGPLAYEDGYRRKRWIHHGSKGQFDEEVAEAEVANPLSRARRQGDTVYRPRAQVMVLWIRNAMETAAEMAPLNHSA